jgi:hypothetical protein
MSWTPPTVDSPWRVELDDDEQIDLTQRIIAGEADEQFFTENYGLARIGELVMLEYGDFHCERFEDAAMASRRFRELRQTLLEHAADKGL